VVNAPRGTGITLPAMPNPRRRLDRRLLLPRDYLADPFQFGHHPHPVWVLPPGGDHRSLRVAMVQHDVALLVRTHCPRAGERVARRFGFSRQYWSKCTGGRAWMGETLLAAAIWALRTAGVWE